MLTAAICERIRSGMRAANEEHDLRRVPYSRVRSCPGHRRALGHDVDIDALATLLEQNQGGPSLWAAPSVG